MKRVASIQISRELIEGFFGEGTAHGAFRVRHGLPWGAVLCGVELTGEHLILSFSHSDFETSKEGERSPVIAPVFEKES
jgi:hypothetical protein